MHVRLRLSVLLAGIIPIGAIAGCLTRPAIDPAIERQWPPPAPPRPPALLVALDPGEPPRPLRIASATVNVDVAGGVASTTLDLTFANDLDRVLEGELVLPLPRGAAISSLAIEVAGSLRRASVVERERARKTFEEVVSRGVDPALAELVRGNCFRTRVYPIPARGTKRLVVGFEQPVSEGRECASCSVPLQFGGRLERFQGDLAVRSEAAPRVDGVAFVWTGGAWRGSIASVFSDTSELRVSLPPTRDRELLIDQGSGERTFVARLRVDPATCAIAPQRFTLLWDASSSADARAHDRELAFLERLFAKLGRGTVRLVVFSNEVWTSPGGDFEIEDGRCPELLRKISGIRSDGGTSFAGLDLARLDPDSRHAILMSDGIATLGTATIATAGRAVMCVTSSAAADDASLDRTATRGAIVDLRELSIDEAVARALAPPLVVTGVSVAANDVTLSVPSRIDGDVITVAGRFDGEPPRCMKVSYERDGVSRTVEIGNARWTPVDAPLARIWANARIRELERDGADHHDEIVRLAKKHGVVTELTSLLVLDSLEDYVRYEVEPPPELADAYASAIAQRAKPAPTTDGLAQLLEAWAKRLAWWSPQPSQVASSPPRLDSASAPRVEVAVDTRKVKDLLAQAIDQIDRQDYDGAQRALDAVLSMDPGNEVARKYAELATEGRHLHEESLQFRSTGRESIDPEELKREGQRLYEAFEYKKAAGKFAAAVAANPNDGEARMFLSRAQLLAGDRRAEFRSVSELLHDEPEGVNNEEMSIPYLDKKGVIFPDKQLWLGKIARRKTGIASADERRREWVETAAPSAPSLPTATTLAAAPELRLRFAPSPTATAGEIYAAYLDLKPAWGASPDLYLEASDRLLERGRRDLALRVLTNLAELSIDDAALLRILAHRLLELHEHALAVAVFDQVARIRPEEPQSWRDLGLARALAGDAPAAARDLEKVARGSWDGRFKDIGLIALGELNHLLARSRAEKRPLACELPDEVTRPIEADLRVVLSWDTDQVDMDLWVTEPTGDKCYYKNRETRSGGRLSSDCTRGYGPEEYVIVKAPKGTYEIAVQFYGSSSQRLSTVSTVHATVFTNYGRPNEERLDVTRRLAGKSDVVPIGKVEWR